MRRSARRLVHSAFFAPVGLPPTFDAEASQFDSSTYVSQSYELEDRQTEDPDEDPILSLITDPPTDLRVEDEALINMIQVAVVSEIQRLEVLLDIGPTAPSFAQRVSLAFCFTRRRTAVHERAGVDHRLVTLIRTAVPIIRAVEGEEAAVQFNNLCRRLYFLAERTRVSANRIDELIALDVHNIRHFVFASVSIVICAVVVALDLVYLSLRLRSFL